MSNKKGELKRVFKLEQISDRTMRRKRWGIPVMSMQKDGVKIDVFFNKHEHKYRIAVSNVNGLVRVDYCKAVNGVFPGTRILNDVDRVKLSSIVENLFNETNSTASRLTYGMWSASKGMGALPPKGSPHQMGYVVPAAKKNTLG